ncbi:hypothetical protein BAUCODRAFT_24080 [Baudoinia panamericana UAMH 10762]|uniref:PLL-like beta propeller domain-containing protein n=1 Tax=Baudoinia panamericana (strain UAMH 10762) TaxID=717646 RepID=M2MXH9_BAUPA|nr:uncharacterized protein BAUCODRAFT_24080 [Baudoinia panamericana UAMH 10762]EMC96273.1 hypothetical protein BAUCODRAFT_24080 [Baudoinia panamericana UAMH 10762]
MFVKALVGVLAATQQACAASNVPLISANSWGNGRIDVFGVAANGSILHKYHGPDGFEPLNPPFENFLGKVISTPTSVSWRENRLDYFVVGTNGSLYNRFWNADDSSWQPWPYHEVLKGSNEGKDFVSVSAASWGSGRLDIVGMTKNGSYLHMYYDGSNFQGWETFGGNFSSAPYIIAPWKGQQRFDVFGLSSNGTLVHNYFDGSNYKPGYAQWEALPGPVKMTSAPVASSWGASDLDAWAVGEDGQLYHTYWRGSDYDGFEFLGGNFTSTPRVVHWGANRTDIIGQFANETQYRYKYGYFNTIEGFWQWSDWAPKGGDFASQPVVVSWQEGNLHILGVGNDGVLYWQMYWPGQWLPSATGYYPLGNMSNPFPSTESRDDQQEKDVETSNGQIVMGSSFKQGL